MLPTSYPWSPSWLRAQLPTLDDVRHTMCGDTPNLPPGVAEIRKRMTREQHTLWVFLEMGVMKLITFMSKAFFLIKGKCLHVLTICYFASSFCIVAK